MNKYFNSEKKNIDNSVFDIRLHSLSIDSDSDINCVNYSIKSNHLDETL